MKNIHFRPRQGLGAGKMVMSQPPVPATAVICVSPGPSPPSSMLHMATVPGRGAGPVESPVDRPWPWPSSALPSPSSPSSQAAMRNLESGVTSKPQCAVPPCSGNDYRFTALSF